MCRNSFYLSQFYNEFSNKYYFWDGFAYLMKPIILWVNLRLSNKFDLNKIDILGGVI